MNENQNVVNDDDWDDDDDDWASRCSECCGPLPEGADRYCSDGCWSMAVERQSLSAQAADPDGSSWDWMDDPANDD